MNKKKVAIVSPYYNEQETILDFLTEINRVIKEINLIYEFEIYLIDDGSFDKTFNELERFNTKLPLTVIKLRKNYGHQIALSMGLRHLKNSDYVIALDSDLQDPPEYIKEILLALDRGNDVVLTYRFQREDQLLKKVTAFLYYRLLRFFSREKFVLDSGDYWGINLKALERLQEYQKNKMIFFRGQLVQLGLKNEIVQIKRHKRLKGKSKYGVKKMIRLALSGFFCTTTFLSRVFLYKLFLLFLINFSLSLIFFALTGFISFFFSTLFATVSSTLITFYFYKELRVEFKKQESKILFDRIQLNDD